MGPPKAPELLLCRLFEPPTNSNSEAFGGTMARATWAQRPLCGSPWVLKYLYCHQVITQTQIAQIFGWLSLTAAGSLPSGWRAIATKERGRTQNGGSGDE